jgi:hypothetical protein
MVETRKNDSSNVYIKSSNIDASVKKLKYIKIVITSLAL